MAAGRALTRRALLGASGGVVLAWLVGGPTSGNGGELLIDPDVRAAAARGPVRVLVELRVPPPAIPGEPAATARERAIATAQQSVLGRLTGTAFTLVRQYATVPLLALEVGADALLALEAMNDLIARVQLDQLRRPSG